VSIVHIPFYPSDWLAGTRGMSDAETGVYITLVARMYEMAGPIERDDDRLFRLCGCKSKAAFVKTLEYLISEGKITESDDGIFNGKVAKVIEETVEKSSKAKAAAESRWNRKSNVSKGPSMRTHPASICPDDANHNHNHNNDDTNVSSRRSDKDQGFEKFWEIWPSKKNKQNARKSWRKLTIDDKRAAYAAVRAGWFDQWQAASPDANPIHASTFLNSRRWEDQESAPKLRPIDGGKSHAKRPIAERLEARFTEMDCGEDRDPSEPLLSTGDRRPDRGGGNDGLDTGAVWLLSGSDQRGM
jgi:uncharacterized protein YdaU (DUF1376 family)